MLFSYRVILPEYHLDFGYVVHGLMVSHCVTLTNIGYFPLSFTTAYSSLTSSGFSVDLGSKVRALPGAPQHETITFNARFDSKLAKLGHAEATLPFQVQICYCASCSHDSRSSHSHVLAWLTHLLPSSFS